MKQASRPNIHVYIDRLILDGLPVDRIQSPHIQMAVQAELRRLFVEHGLASELQAGGTVPQFHTHPIHFAAGSNPTEMGTQIARSVYSGIGNKR